MLRLKLFPEQHVHTQIPGRPPGHPACTLSRTSPFVPTEARPLQNADLLK